MARPRQPRDFSRRHRLTYLGIALFVLADVGLIAVAIGASHSANTMAKPGPIPTFEATAPASAAGSGGKPTPTPSATATADAVAPTRILSALNATTAWRAITGACPATAASPELSTDSGATWKATNATGPTKITALQRIIVSSPASATMIGLSQTGCAPELVKTFVAGRNFASYPKELASAWFVDPSTRGSVHSPAGDKPAPCPAVVAIAASDAKSAAILCADHTAYVTSDAAVTWSRPLAVPGAGNLAVSAKGFVATASADSRCVGVRLVSLSGVPLAVGTTACLPLDALPTADHVAVSEASGTLWVWAGGSLKRSGDGGATWQ
jgi:hypothetical protein